MSITTLVQALGDRLRARKVEQATSNQARYREILEAVNRGEAVSDLDEVETILEALGKTLSDIPADAELLMQRLQWAADAELIPTHQRAMDSAQAKLDAANAEYSRIVTEHQARAKELYTEVRHHEQLIMIATAHRDRLAATCTDPTVKAREAELHKLGVELVPEERELRGAITTLDARIRSAQSLIDVCQKRIDEYSNSPNFVKKEREQLGEHKTAIEGYKRQRQLEQAKLDEVTQQQQAIQAERAQLERRKLIP